MMVYTGFSEQTTLSFLKIFSHELPPHCHFCFNYNFTNFAVCFVKLFSKAGFKRHVGLLKIVYKHVQIFLKLKSLFSLL